MPNVVRSAADEAAWHKAREIVATEYPDVKPESNDYWRLVMGVFKRATDKGKDDQPTAKAHLAWPTVRRRGLVGRTLGRWFGKAGATDRFHEAAAHNSAVLVTTEAKEQGNRGKTIEPQKHDKPVAKAFPLVTCSPDGHLIVKGREVKEPGKRGGKFWYRKGGKLAYGEQYELHCVPCGLRQQHRGREVATSAAERHDREHHMNGTNARVYRDGEAPESISSRTTKPAAFSLAPPDLGETRSGKLVPHPELNSAYHHNGQLNEGYSWKDWTAEDHQDAAEMHDKYARYHARTNMTLAVGHTNSMHAHQQQAEYLRHGPPSRQMGLFGESRAA